MADFLDRPDWKQAAAVLLGVGFAVVLLGLFVVILSIGSGIRRYSDEARQTFPGDRITALMAVVDCESCSLTDRNHAVWALGQLADRRALPVLHKYYTGQTCDHLRALCQHELQKALKLAEAGSNPSAFLWRWMLPAKS
jgi:hypothetical protein